MAHTIFNSFLHSFALQDLNLVSDTLKVALMPSSFLADRDANNSWADISIQEVTGEGYTAGGMVLTGTALDRQDASDNVKFTANDVSWVASTLTARYAVIYKDTGDATTSTLIAAIDFGADKSSVNGTFTVQWNPDGIFTLSQAV